MGMCPACGAPTETGDRFCSACGEALGAPGLTADPYAGWAASDPPDEPGLLLLEPAPAGPAGEQGTAAGRRSPRTGLMVAAGVLAAAVALWGLGRGGADEGGPDDAARPASTTATSILRIGTTATTASTTVSDAGAGEPVPTYDPDEGGPVLGQPVGWSLLIGEIYDNGLERIDLDSGEVTRYDQASGGPVAVVDGRLLLQALGDDGGVHLRAVPLDDPAADGTDLVADSYSSSDPWPMFPGRDGGLWIFASTAEASTWRLVRVSDGELIDEVPAPPVFQVSPLRRGGPDVATSPGGGLYRRDGNGYRLLHPARPLVIDRDAALVVSCTLPDACVTQWVDLERGEPIDRPLPPDDGGIDWAGTADDAGRFLFGWRSGSAPVGRLVLYDTSRRRLVEVGAMPTMGELVATPDGRYLAVQTAGDIRIFDADQDRWVALPRPGGLGGANLLFVPNGGGPG